MYWFVGCCCVIYDVVCVLFYSIVVNLYFWVFIVDRIWWYIDFLVVEICVMKYLRIV